MRIIGGHDYYDSGLAYGQDESVIFVRSEDRTHHNNIETILGITENRCSARLTANKKKINGSRLNYLYRRNYDQIVDRWHEHTMHVAHVVICGKLYNGFYIQRFDRRTCIHHDHWIWNAENLRAYAKEYDLTLNEGSKGAAKSWESLLNGSRGYVQVTLLPLEEWMTPVKLSGAAREYLVEQRITIATKNPYLLQGRGSHDENGWDIDRAVLGSMEFAKALDPYTAFQEISMWLGGVIPKQGPEIVEITDNRIKIEKHGFHHPTSFRKARQS